MCDKTLGPSPFKKPEATHIIIADFYGIGPGDRQFADTVGGQIDAELKRFQEEELPKMPVNVPPEAVEFERLRCFVNSHQQAEQVAEAWNADLVIWGRAYCNARPEVQQRIHVEQHIETGDIKGNENQVGIVNVAAPKPYAVCPSATLHRSEARLRKSAEALDVGSLAHLSLPTLSSTAPFQLVHFTLGLHFYERDQPWIAARFFERSVKEVLSPRDENLAILHAYLGRAFLHLPGSAERAMQYSKSALTSILGSGSAVEATLLNNIGSALDAQGQHAEAAEYYERALKIDEKALGLDHPSTAIDVNNIGEALRQQGHYAKAIKYYERALKIDEKALGADHPSTARDLNNIGVALDDQGQYAEAIKYYEQALKIDEKALGADHPSTARDLNNIGDALRQQGQYAEAILYFERALKIDEKALGADHPSTATNLNNIGEALRQQGQYAEAIKYYEQALKIDEKALGADHPSTARDLNNIGEALRQQGQYGQAIEYTERALKIDEKALGPDHPSTARDLNNIGEALRQQGQYRQAIAYTERALAILQRSLGAEHPLTKTAGANLALAIAGASGRHGPERGPVVMGVAQGASPATLEFKPGDWIVRYDGAAVESAEHVTRLAQAKKGAPRVELVIVRGGKRLEMGVAGGELGVELVE